MSSLLLSANRHFLLLSAEEEAEAVLLLCANDLLILLCAMLSGTKVPIVFLTVYSPRRRTGPSSFSILNVFGTEEEDVAVPLLSADRLVLLLCAVLFGIKV